jgi:hypothetical protein
MNKCFKNNLKLIDIFGTPLQINIRSKRKYSTALGGLLTLLTMFLFIFFGLYFGQDLYLRKNPKLINYKSYIVDNETYINNTNFFVAFQAEYANGTLLNFEDKNALFPIEIYSESLDSIYQGKVQPPSVHYKTRKCLKSELDSFHDVAEDIKKAVIDKFSCIDLAGQGVRLWGAPFHSLETMCLRLNIKVNYTKLIELYTIDPLAWFSHSSGPLLPLWFRLFYQSYSYDPDNFEDPFKKELAVAVIQVIPTNIIHIYGSFNKAKSVRDDAVLFGDKNTTYIYGFNGFQLATLDNFLVNIAEVQPQDIMKSFFYLDYSQDIFLRSYPKIQDIAAQVSAIMKAFLILFQFGTFFYNMIRIREQLAYKFFRYMPEKNIMFKSQYEAENISDRPLINVNGSLEMRNINNYMQESNNGAVNSNRKTKMFEQSRIMNSATTLPKLFTNSIFHVGGVGGGGNNPSSSNQGPSQIPLIKEQVHQEVRRSLNKNMRKMAIKFKIGRSVVRNSLAKRQTGRGTFFIPKNDKNELTTTSINKEGEFENNSRMSQTLPSFTNIDHKQQQQNKYENINHLQQNQSKNAVKPVMTPKSKVRVIESSLRPPITHTTRGQRTSYKVNNDRGYILDFGGHEEENVNSEGAGKNKWKNFSEKDMIKPKEKLGFSDKFRGLFCPTNKLTPKLKTKLEFYEKAGNRINERVDIFYFLNLFDEFQKFKILFLNPYQTLALRYSKKANIFHINFNNVVDFYEKFCYSKDDQVNINEVMNYFTGKLQAKNMDLMDQKLLELLDGDLKKAILLNV